MNFRASIVRAARNLYWACVPACLSRRLFHGSCDYWERRYTHGGNSGSGSQGRFAAFKAEVVNGFVQKHGVRSVIEFGSGDGSQLRLARYPAYVGVDVSETAVQTCRTLFANDTEKEFLTLNKYDGRRAELALSMDVIYHLVEEDVYAAYLRRLFDAAERYVIVYSSDTDDNADAQGPHIRHRKWSAWVARNRSEWKLVERIPNRYPYEGDGTRGSFADFFIFERVA
jgi:hypothetical protein